MNDSCGLSIRAVAAAMLALVVILALAGGAHGAELSQAAEQSRRTLELLCKDQPAEQLRTLPEARALIEYVKTLGDDSGGLICDSRLLGAIVDLELVLASDSADNQCTQARVDRIGDYMAKYVRANAETPLPASGIKLPKSLRDLFIAFGVKVSKVCKRALIKLLIPDTNSVLKREEFKEISAWTSREDAAMRKFMDTAVEFDNLFLVVGDHKPRAYEEERTKIYIQTTRVTEIQGMRNICHNRFRPFYEKLVLPLVRMSVHGFEYNGKDIRDEFHKFQDTEGVQLWYKIVFLCESVLRIVPVVKPKDEPVVPDELHIDDAVLDKVLEKDLEDEMKHDDEAAAAAAAAEGKEGDEATSSSSADGEAKEGEDGDDLQGSAGDETAAAAAAAAEGPTQEKKKKKHTIITGRFLLAKLRKLEKEREALHEAKKNMPVTHIMSHSQIAEFERTYGKINETFGDTEPVVYEPKPRIEIDSVLISPDDKYMATAIQDFDKERFRVGDTLRRFRERMSRLARRFTWLGKLRFGSARKEDDAKESHELMLEGFDKYMWAKDNADLLNTSYGKIRTMLEFQNFSNIITIASFLFSIVACFAPFG